MDEARIAAETLKVAWVSAAGTALAAAAAILAAAAAVAAAVYTKRAANEARNAAKAAADQVELARPRPIVIVSFARCFAESRGNMAPADISLRLENIGNSPAFDVEVSPLETPGSVPNLGVRSRLETSKLPYLTQGNPVSCEHQVEPSQGVLSALRGAAAFVDNAREFFDHEGRATHSPLDMRHEIKFTVSYRALDRRRFEQSYVFVVYFPQLTAWVEAVGSLLEGAI